MVDFLRPILARLVGSFVGALAVWFASKYGIIIPDEVKGELTQNAVALMLLVFGIVYSLVHRAVSVKVNPTDTASPAIAKAVTEEIKIEKAREP